MQVNVEDISSVKKKLHIEIPHEAVAEKLDEAYDTIRKTAKIKGFRPGKAPRTVLVRLYKNKVHSDVSSQLIQETFSSAVMCLYLVILLMVVK